MEQSTVNISQIHCSNWLVVVSWALIIKKTRYNKRYSLPGSLLPGGGGEEEEEDNTIIVRMRKSPIHIHLFPTCNNSYWCLLGIGLDLKTIFSFYSLSRNQNEHAKNSLHWQTLYSTRVWQACIQWDLLSGTIMFCSKVNGNVTKLWFLNNV